MSAGKARKWSFWRIRPPFIMSLFVLFVRVTPGPCSVYRQIGINPLLIVHWVVREPRAVLKEFDLDVPDDVEIRVWDSNSEVRYMVLPQQPEGTEHLSEEELVSLITRDAMIGVSKVDAPTELAKDE